MYVIQRLKKLRRHRSRIEDGATVVMVVVMITALLGLAALSVDYAVASSDKSSAQNAADAAALSIARECAMKTAKCTPAGATSEMNWSIAQNAPGKTGTAAPAVTYANKEVTVTMNGARPAMFAQLASFDSNLNVAASAKASWGVVAVDGPVDLPVGIGYCDWKSANPGGSPSGAEQQYVFGDLSNFFSFTNTDCQVDAATIPAAAGRSLSNSSKDLGKHQMGWINSDILGISTSCEARIRTWNRFQVFSFDLFNSQHVCDPKGIALSDKLKAAKDSGKDGVVILIPVYGIQKWYLNIFGLITLSGNDRLTFHGFAPFELQGFMTRRTGRLTGIEVGSLERSTDDRCRFRPFNSDLYYEKCRGFYGEWVRTTKPIEGWEYSTEYNNGVGADFGATKVALID